MTSLEQFTRSLIGDGAATAAAALVLQGSEVLGEAYERADSASLFDLASVTKPFTATLALVLDQSGDLPLATPVGAIWEEADPRVAQVTLEQLLRHQAGMRRWMPLYEVCADRADVCRQLLGGEWLDAEGEVYSDLDFMLWAMSAEQALGASYSDLLRERVLEPLGAEQFSFGDDVTNVLGCALPTGKEVALAAAVGIEVAEQPAPELGQPQDGNTRFLGSSCGHAGLFATLAGVQALAGIYSAPGGLLSEESLLRSAGSSGRYGLGWFRAGETAAGRSLGSQAFGHEGFVGSSLWLDPADDRVLILLAHRSSLTIAMAGVRERFHRLSAEL